MVHVYDHTIFTFNISEQGMSRKVVDQVVQEIIPFHPSSASIPITHEGKPHYMKLDSRTIDRSHWAGKCSIVVSLKESVTSEALFDSIRRSLEEYAKQIEKRLLQLRNLREDVELVCSIVSLKPYSIEEVE